VSPQEWPQEPNAAGNRVLVVAPQPFYEDRGTPIAVRLLLCALSELGYQVDLLTYPLGRALEIPRVRYLRSRRLPGVQKVPIGLSVRKVLLDAVLVPELARRMAYGNYACVHAVEEAAFPAVLLGRRHGVPVIYDMQSSLPEQLAKHAVFRSGAAQALLLRCERWLLERADSVVGSAGLANRVRSLAPGARVREWCFPSTLAASPPGDVEELRRTLGIAPGRPVVLYTGTFEAYQGLPELLQAIPRVLDEVPNVTFVLVGADSTGDTPVRRNHVDLIRSGALRVVLRQPREKIPSYLALADVAVSPRAYGDNLPLKVFDYLAAGRPIVATDIPAHRSVLDEGCALLTRGRPADLAQAVVRLLRDRELANRLASAGRARAVERFGWYSFVRAVDEIYREVCRAA
jgi:glycosyltransferase involved in cell wall biosynthesis